MRDSTASNPRHTAGYLSVPQFVRILRENRIAVLAPTVIVAALAFVVGHLLPPTWEAIGVVQVGAVGQSSVGQGVQLIESPVRAVERARMRVFQDAVLARLGIPQSETDPQGRLYRGTARIKQLQSTDFLEIRLRAYSPVDARRWIDATVEQMAEAHRKLAEPTLDRLRTQLAETEATLLRLKTLREEIRSATTLRREIDPGERFAESVYNANLLVASESDIRKNEDLRSMLLEQLSATRTYPTALVDKVFVGDEPVSPRKILIVVVASLLGLFSGIALAYFLDGRRSAREAATT